MKPAAEYIFFGRKLEKSFLLCALMSLSRNGKISELWGKHWIQLGRCWEMVEKLLGSIEHECERKDMNEQQSEKGKKESKLNLLDFYDYCALTFSLQASTTNNNNNIQRHSSRAEGYESLKLEMRKTKDFFCSFISWIAKFRI